MAQEKHAAFAADQWSKAITANFVTIIRTVLARQVRVGSWGTKCLSPLQPTGRRSRIRPYGKLTWVGSLTSCNNSFEDLPSLVELVGSGSQTARRKFDAQIAEFACG
jgi:hypothetical protein